MAKFYKLKVSDVRHETDECVSIAFTIPPTLKNDFTYHQGQYITFKLNVDGEEIRRSYSICSSPLTETELRVAIKQVKDGRGSIWLNKNVKAGDELEVMTPMGNFYSALDKSHKKHYVLFAGGSGITPMLSIIKTVIVAEPESKLVLFYGNRDEKSIIFRKQLEAFAVTYPDRFKLVNIIENPSLPPEDGYKGLLTEDKVKILLSKHVDLKLDNEFFICGPTPMMVNVKKALEETRIDSKKIHIEYFAASADTPKQQAIPENQVIVSKVKVIIDGIETSFELKSNNSSVLDAAIEAGADAPFSCKGAVCCTCRAKVMEGKVKMDMNYALSEDEVKSGYVLTCQSHPLTPVVVIDYDQT